MPPVGNLPLEILPESPKSVWVKWEVPAKPNGNLSYTVLFTGTFFQPSGENSSKTEEPVTETRALLTTVTAGHWVSVGGLLPFSNYSVSVRACNSQGCVESTSSSISLPSSSLRAESHLSAEGSVRCLITLKQAFTTRPAGDVPHMLPDREQCLLLVISKTSPVRSNSR
ncbi:hypothetical protein AMELA_G00121590 [Ameiurus melas]|uniref:Fibronectin type-III domain-containing protein n=1 Tax=Ameiurus melas TaxID=219545 RepID=A0A7J6AP11_AMEME|nr:hypothetical protein AMELA_G00121590 [Ameiurus melas]